MQRLPDPHLTPNPVPSANAAEGGLEPPPEGRLRRANILHLSYSTTLDSFGYLTLPPVFVAHTAL